MIILIHEIFMWQNDKCEKLQAKELTIKND